jgi:hypothetical protein
MLGTAADNTACPLLTRTIVLPSAAAAVAADTRRSVTVEEETNNSKTEEERIPEDVERKIMENINRGETRREGSGVHQYKNRYLQLMHFDQSVHRWVPGTGV